MNKLLVQRDNNKFVNNIQHTQCDNINIGIADIKNYLYDMYYANKFNAMIFMASYFDQEIYQFINEYHNTVKIFIYHNTVRPELFDLSKTYNIKQIIPNTYQSVYNKIKNIFLEPILVNKNLYQNHKGTQKQRNIVSFIDHVDSLPNELIEYLYPKTKLPIKLFNNSKIKHYQNIGLLNEYEKSQLLISSEFYVAINGYYAPEAMVCGCTVLDINELDDLKPNKYKHKKEYQTYSNYIENFIYG